MPIEWLFMQIRLFVYVKQPVEIYQTGCMVAVDKQWSLTGLSKAERL